MIKKLLVLIISLTLIIGLSACDSTSQDYLELEDRVEELESRATLIEDIMVGLGIMQGLNGVLVPYYTEPQLNELASLSNKSLLVRLNASTTAELIVIKDTLDKTKIPSYLIDENGDYVSFQKVAQELKLKYYGVTDYSRDMSDMGGKALIQYVVYGEYDLNDFIARTVLLIEELRNYDFYLLSCPELYLYIVYNDEVITISIPLVVMINEAFTINLDGIISGDYEMEVTGGIFDKVLAQQYYDDYVTKLTYDGYVLNYK